MNGLVGTCILMGFRRFRLLIIASRGIWAVSLWHSSFVERLDLWMPAPVLVNMLHPWVMISCHRCKKRGMHVL